VALFRKSNNFLVYTESPIKDSLMQTGFFFTEEHFNSNEMGQHFSNGGLRLLQCIVMTYPKHIFHEIRFLKLGQHFSLY
jgi:hypothetical protein